MYVPPGLGCGVPAAVEEDERMVVGYSGEWGRGRGHGSDDETGDGEEGVEHGSS